MGDGESIVVLGRRSLPSNSETELGFVSCVSHGVSHGGDGIKVIDEQAFRDAMFPWFEPRTAPVHTSDLPEIISQPYLANASRSWACTTWCGSRGTRTGRTRGAR